MLPNLLFVRTLLPFVVLYGTFALFAFTTPVLRVTCYARTYLHPGSFRYLLHYPFPFPDVAHVYYLRSCDVPRRVAICDVTVRLNYNVVIPLTGCYFILLRYGYVATRSPLLFTGT